MRFKRIHISVTLMAVTLSMVSCIGKKDQRSFKEAHDEFKTKIETAYTDKDEIPEPPEGIFDLVEYPSTVGDLAAYVSCDPEDGQKHPLIIWIAGGWGNGIDDSPWAYADWENDQSASAFWTSGILTMYPSFRGACGNPGIYESFFGEIDDIAAAYDYAASLPYVDPERIYLGGHSTGGTRALLAAEYTDNFRAVFSFGPVDKMDRYGDSDIVFDTSDKEEYVMRSPIYWLDDIKTPVFVIEGEDGNALCAQKIKKKSKNDNISCYVVDGADHFSVLAPVTNLLADKILNDTGDKADISITQDELQDAIEKGPQTD